MGGEYEDYITGKPEGFRLINNKVMITAKKHTEILHALKTGNLTVKEIYETYKRPDGKYTKTLKTVYRYLDTLEQLDLIMVAGHRKYKGARSLEKLYCRTAKVFSDDQTKKKEWLQTEDGKKFLDSMTEVLWRMKDGNGDKAELRKLVEKYFSKIQDHSNDLIKSMSNEEKYRDIIEESSFDHIRGLLEMMPHILTALESGDLTEKIRKELS